MASEEPQDVAARSLTPEERRAGYRRLALAGAILVGLALLVGLVLVALGGRRRHRASVPASGWSGSSWCWVGWWPSRAPGASGASHGQVRMATDAERKDAERLALGLLGTGIIFSVVSLALA